MKKSLFALFVSSIAIQAQAAEWDSYPVPANAGAGNTWQLQSLSDDFNYNSTAGNRPSQFTSRWKEGFVNAWTGPSLTEWNAGHVWSNGDLLAIQAHQKPNSNKIYMGGITSKSTVQYPVYLEARVRLSDLTTANNFWMLSADSNEEIDILETYPSSRAGQEWFDQRIHLSHHALDHSFTPFLDYQPRDEEGVSGTWYWESGRDTWRGEFFRIGVYWKSPWHLEYYINGRWVRTLSSNSYSYLDENGSVINKTANFNVIDKYNYTKGTGLSKPMHVIINMEQQSWRTDNGDIPTAVELSDANNKNIYWLDWVRVYKPVASGSGGGDNGGGDNGGGDNGGGDNGGGSVSVPGGITELRNKNSNRCVDLAAGSSANGTAIHQWGCSASNTNQDFRFVSKGGGWYEINSKHNKCVGVAGGSNSNGAELIQWDCFANNLFQFQLVDKGNGWFQMKNRNSGKCVAINASSKNNGAKLIQWTCNNNADQQFKFE
ncbi:RICIN domain-containing protein [Agaribacterium haliotis]|uniref:RICIN domain-containing protein n=1 Tax=Agaribacterium haliotis TaxID=2013869 RepID=UPI000BB52C09|nr:RICIN domain-containing protein [Agaribacterium haliotis]